MTGFLRYGRNDKGEMPDQVGHDVGGSVGHDGKRCVGPAMVKGIVPPRGVDARCPRERGDHKR